MASGAALAREQGGLRSLASACAFCSENDLCAVRSLWQPLVRSAVENDRRSDSERARARARCWRRNGGRLKHINQAQRWSYLQSPTKYVSRSVSAYEQTKRLIGPHRTAQPQAQHLSRLHICHLISASLITTTATTAKSAWCGCSCIVIIG